MSEFDLSGDTSADYGFDGTDSFTSGSENVSTTGPSGGGGDENFFGGSDYNVMDFGRGPVSNITNSPNYDPNFAALGMIGRGLTPGFDLRNQINFDVPASMLPQLEGSRGPLGPKFYSPLERTLVEMEPVGIMAMAGKAFESIKNSFTDAKNTLGKMGDAAGGFSLSDLFSSANPMSDMPNEQANMGTLDPSDRFLGDMSQQGARMNVTDPVVNTPNVNMGSIPQVSPTFDAFGNVTRDADISRFADDIGQTRAGISNLLPEQSREASVTVDDATRSLQGPPAFINKEIQRIPGGFNITGKFDYPGTDRDTRMDRFIKTGSGEMRPTEQDVMDSFLKNMYTRSQTPIEKTSEANINPGSILRGIGSRFQPQINQFLKQNVNEKLDFESGFRPDINDPNKMMPYMGVRFPFNIG